jgi:hypothetical protein
MYIVKYVGTLITVMKPKESEVHYRLARLNLLPLSWFYLPLHHVMQVTEFDKGTTRSGSSFTVASSYHKAGTICVGTAQVNRAVSSRMYIVHSVMKTAN